jgi:hypothetical protein
MKPVCLFFILAAALIPAAPLRADTAGGPPEGVLRTAASFSAASALDSWNDAAPDNYQFLGFGFSAEYGVLPWASLAVHWLPGALVSAYSFRGGSEGSFSDLRFSARFSLVNAQLIRLDLSTGLSAPVPSEAGTAWEPGLRLWGASAGFSLDFLPLPFFQLNLAAAATYYPVQATDNPAFSRLAASHPLDFRAELEPRFNFLFPRGVVVTLPAVYEFSPRSSVRGRPLDDERHGLSLGLGGAMAVRDAPLPFEVGMKFLLPLYGLSGPRVHRAEFTARMDIPLKRPGDGR